MGAFLEWWREKNIVCQNMTATTVLPATVNSEQNFVRYF